MPIVYKILYVFDFIDDVFIWLMPTSIVLFQEYKIAYKTLILFFQILFSP